MSASCFRGDRGGSNTIAPAGAAGAGGAAGAAGAGGAGGAGGAAGAAGAGAGGAAIGNGACCCCCCCCDSASPLGLFVCGCTVIPQLPPNTQAKQKAMK